jgi:hypothetical protein
LLVERGDSSLNHGPERLGVDQSLDDADAFEQPAMPQRRAGMIDRMDATILVEARISDENGRKLNGKRG